MAVTLVGAGPGDAGLLTIKGREKLAEAEVVLFDRLVGDEILELIPQTAEKINVGKHVNDHPVPQAEINQILLEKGLAGKKVVRLKGGDPFVFGRGGEELELLVRHGVPFEVVPGITSAIAGAAYAGIPVTQRGEASSFHVITGHAKGSEPLAIDFEALARTGGTLIFLMGVGNLGKIRQGLMAAGMSQDMPVAIVENATLPQQRKLLSTLGEMEAQAQGEAIQSPALIVVGQVTRRSEAYDWFMNQPLKGQTVIVTRARTSPSNLSRLLRADGARVLEVPSISIRPLWQDSDEFQRVLSKLQNYNWLLFTSRNGVTHFFDGLFSKGLDARALAGMKISVVGSETKKALKEYGLVPDYMPSTYYGKEMAQGLIKRSQKSESFLLMGGKVLSEDLPKDFQASGRRFHHVAVYETLFADAGVANQTIEEADFITFSSGSTVEGFVQSYPNLDYRQLHCIAIGETTAAKARQFGFQVEVADQATVAKMRDKMKELVRHED